MFRKSEHKTPASKPKLKLPTASEMAPLVAKAKIADKRTEQENKDLQILRIETFRNRGKIPADALLEKIRQIVTDYKHNNNSAPPRNESIIQRFKRAFSHTGQKLFCGSPGASRALIFLNLINQNEKWVLKKDITQDMELVKIDNELVIKEIINQETKSVEEWVKVKVEPAERLTNVFGRAACEKMKAYHSLLTNRILDAFFKEMGYGAVPTVNADSGQFHLHELNCRLQNSPKDEKHEEKKRVKKKDDVKKGDSRPSILLSPLRMKVS